VARRQDARARTRALLAATGDSYKGEFHDGKRTWQGEQLVAATGSRYKGEYLNGEWEYGHQGCLTQGEFFYADTGDYYTHYKGEWAQLLVTMASPVMFYELSCNNTHSGN
jgi:hypothetical protein